MKIGFVDYNLNNFHANKFLELFRGELASLGIEIAHSYGLVEAESQEWCAQHGVGWLDSPEAVVEATDAVMVLSPDNAEKHLDLARRTFQGKPVYVDKTFADSVANAEAIIDLAEKTKTPTWSSSALRFAPALRAFLDTDPQIEDVEGRGPGIWNTYGVHTVEPVITLMGPNIRRVRAVSSDKIMRMDIEWQDGRTGHLTVNNHGGQGFALAANTPDGIRRLDLNDPAFYTELCKAVGAFFQSGKPPVPLSETLVIIRLLELAPEAARSGNWIGLP